MRVFNAVSLAPDVDVWLASSGSPSVLHVFEQACNLINEHGEVLSVVTQPIGNGPFNLVVDSTLLFSEHLESASPVSAHGNRLLLGGMTIHTADAKRWNPRPDWGAIHARKNDIVDTLADVRAELCEPSGLPAARTLMSELCSSIAAVEIPSAGRAALKLAGLGYGLTPAGDDYIVGALLAAWMIFPPETAGLLAREISMIAAPRTTSLSAAWVRSAGKGNAGALWHDFFDALVHNADALIQTSVRRILAVGETSGADALAGFFGVCNSWVDEGDCG